MVRYNKCMFCKERMQDASSIKQISIARLYGWLSCVNCIHSGIAKQNVADGLTASKDIPFGGLVQ